MRDEGEMSEMRDVESTDADDASRQLHQALRNLQKNVVQLHCSTLQLVFGTRGILGLSMGDQYRQKRKVAL
eukprot:1138224-Rhodomonas_salina.1